jgi:hypothetical protein
VIAKVSRGWAVGNLLRYLMGPGRANEHVDQRVFATWDGAPELHQPPRTASGCGSDVRDLVDDLTDPALAGRVSLTPPTGVDGTRRRGPVWHCSLRNHRRDRELSDTEWTEVVEDLMDRTGIRGRDDPGGCRWVAVRHAADHIHVAAVLVRTDNGRRVHPRNDYYRAGEVCRDAEQRLGLTPTAPADRTAARQPTRAEYEKAKRRQAPETTREWLRRQVRTAAVQAPDPESFFTHLWNLGVLVRARQTRDGQLVGYAVAAPGDVNADGLPVWFGGRRLAPDLSLPALRDRWRSAATPADSFPPIREELSVRRDDRAAVVADAARAAEQARTALRHAGSAAGPLVAHATADLLTALCAVTNRGSTSSAPMSTRSVPWEVADSFDRAARTPSFRHILRQPGRWAPVAEELRRAARGLAALRSARDDDTGMAELMVAMALLVAEIAAYHEERQHLAQRTAARRSYRVLERVGAGPDRGGRPKTAAHPARVASATLLPPRGGPARPTAAPGTSSTSGRPTPTPPIRPPHPPGTGRGKSR